jgi:hypothetical protein
MRGWKVISNNGQRKSVDGEIVQESADALSVGFEICRWETSSGLLHLEEQRPIPAPGSI